MVGLMGFSTSFAISGMISLIGTAFVPFMVTETTDRSVGEIQIELYGNRILPRGSVTEMKSVNYPVLDHENTNALFRSIRELIAAK